MGKQRLVRICLTPPTNDLIDTDNGVILDVEATRSIRQAEVGSVRIMIDRVNDSFGLLPERLIADTAYGTGDMLDWLDQQRGIAPHIPVVDKSARMDGTFERADFTYDAENDVYACPGGKELKQSRRAFTIPREKKPDEDGMLRYRASKTDCDACALNALLSRGTRAQGHPVNLRTIPGSGAGDRPDPRLRHLLQTPEKGRDAVRAFEAYPGPHHP